MCQTLGCILLQIISFNAHNTALYELLQTNPIEHRVVSFDMEKLIESGLCGSCIAKGHRNVFLIIICWQSPFASLQIQSCDTSPSIISAGYYTNNCWPLPPRLLKLTFMSKNLPQSPTDC